jgi:hypothetical protein
MWWGADDILKAVFSNKKVAVQSGHSMSKDWTAGFLIIQWLLTYYDQAKVIITAPTDRQVREVIFGEVEKQWGRMCSLYPEFKRDQLTTNKLDIGTECFALGFTTRETSGTVGKFQGFKSPNILVIISEAQAVPATVYEQIWGLRTSENSRILELGNPLVEFGKFWEHCTNPRYGYKIIKLSCFDSPNVKAGREIIPGMVTLSYIKELREEIGQNYEDNPQYQSRVLGEFPQQSTNAWIPLSKIKLAVNRKFINDDIIAVGGLDVAREGNDETVHCVLRGRAQHKQDCFEKVLTPETVGWMRGLIEAGKLEAVAVDLGYNPGVFDDLNELSMPVIGINFGGTSPSEKFENLGTYMWFLLRQAFMNNEIGILDDPILVSQLASRKAGMMEKGKIKLESKSKTGSAHWDRADALALAWYARFLTVGDQDNFSKQNISNESSRLDEFINSSSSDLTRKITKKLSLGGASALDEELDDVGISGAGDLDSDSLRL